MTEQDLTPPDQALTDLECPPDPDTVDRAIALLNSPCHECQMVGFHKLSCVSGGKSNLRFTANKESGF